MPTIYRYTEPHVVTADRYAELIKRVGWYSSPTAPVADGTQHVSPVNSATVATAKAEAIAAAAADATTKANTAVTTANAHADTAHLVMYLNDFNGADPTGVAVSTTAVQSAMNQAVATGATLLVPPGTYRVGKLTVPAGLVMTGYHPSGMGIATSKQSRFTLVNGTNDNMLLGDVGSAHVRISNMHFDGNKNNNTAGDIIHLNDTATAEEAQWHIRDCFIDAAPAYGIYVGTGRRAVQISDCTVNYSGSSGIRINGSDSHIDRCILGSNARNGISVGGTVCSVNDCDIYGNGTDGDSTAGDGIGVLTSITMVSLRGNRIDQNKRHGINVNLTCEAITITGNIFHGNSQLTNGAYNDVNVLTLAGTVTVANNTFAVDGNVTNKAGYAIALAASATCLGMGNVVQSGAVVTGTTNAPKRLSQTADFRSSPWEPSAAVLANMDRRNAIVGNVASIHLSGRLTLCGGMVIPAGVTVSTVSFMSGNTALATPTNQWACLVDQAGNVLAKSTDDTTNAWTGNAVKTFTFTTPYTPTKDTPVYAGLLLVGGTMPDMRATNASTPVNGLAPVLSGTANTGLTNPASLGATIGAITANAANPYVYAS